MVDIPGSNNLLGPYGTFGGERWFTTGAVTLRAWSSSYAAEQGFTYATGVERGVTTFEQNIANDAFRHNFMAAAIYIDSYNKNISKGMSPAQADSQAAYKALSDGSFNEWWQSNPLNNHLKDYWNNYSGVEIGRQVVLDGQPNISNSDLAGRVGDVIRDSLARPGEGAAIILPGAGRYPSDIFGEQARVGQADTDPRLSSDKYDMDRITGVGNFMPSSVQQFRDGDPDSNPFVNDPLGNYIPNVISSGQNDVQVNGWGGDKDTSAANFGGTTDSNTNGWGMNDAGMGTWGGDKDTSLADLGDNGKLGDTGTAPTKFSSLNDTLFDTGSNYDNGAATEADYYGVGGYGGNNEMETRCRNERAMFGGRA